MSNTTGRQQRPTARKATPLQVMHQQASARTDQAVRQQSEVERELVRLEAAESMLHSAITTLDERLASACFYTDAAGHPEDGPVEVAESSLGNAIQTAAQRVQGATNRLHRLLGALRV